MVKVKFEYISLILKLFVINLVLSVLAYRFLLDFQISGLSIEFNLAYTIFKIFFVVMSVLVNVSIGLVWLRDYSDKR